MGRSSLREAIATLEATGFVEVRKRKGVYVRSLSARIIYDPLRLLLQEDQGKIRSLYELRRDIETAASYRAAQVRSPAGLKHLEELLARLQDSAESLSLILDYDFQFHLAVATLADNFLRVSVLKDLLELHKDCVGVAHANLGRDQANRDILYAQHRAVFEAIRDQDAERARQAMQRHLTWVEERCRAMSGDPA